MSHMKHQRQRIIRLDYPDTDSIGRKRDNSGKIYMIGSLKISDDSIPVENAKLMSPCNIFYGEL